MRKANKILMATVAILLCLVLISTSVVSGIFAKFIITKTAQTSMVIEKFGMRLIVTPDTTNLENAGATVNLTNQNSYKRDVIHVEITNLQMAPGDSFYEALCVDIEGTPNVPIIFRMSCRIEYTTNDYKVGNTYYMPLGYTIQTGNVRTDLCYPYKENTDGSKLGEIVVRNIYNNLYGTSYTKDNKPNDVIFQDTATSDWCFVKPYAAGSSGDNILAADAKARDFYLGFDFPDKGRDSKGETSTNYDDIVTTLSEQSSPIKIIFSFTIEQA